MAEDPRYPSSSGSWRDAIRNAQEQARATEELTRKEEQRRSVEERTAPAEERSARVRTGLSDATAGLSQRLVSNADALRVEGAALEANIALMERSLRLRQQLGGAGIVGGGGSRVVSGSSGVVASGIAEDPNAAARLSAAQRALAEAELARSNAQTEVTRARRRTGTTSETLTPLVEQREVAAQQVVAARQELRAAQTNVQAQEALAQANAQQLAEQRQINTAMQAERAARERVAAEANAAAAPLQESALGLRASTLGTARRISPLSAGAQSYLEAQAAQANLALLPQPSALPRLAATGYRAGLPGALPGTLAPGPSNTLALPADEEQAARLKGLREEATLNARAVANLGQEQAKANQAFQQANAIYADNSSRLTRHGALTTEFISSLANGQVSLREFGSQMTATIGKFGGWAIAGAAVYGVYDAFKHLISGATETQAAVQQLGRFIPGLGGPAGGGTGQVAAAGATVRDISSQFNVPISEVTDAMSVTARRFHNLADAGEAARAVLAASRLDQVPQALSSQYLTGISQALGFTKGSQLTGVVDSLNALQSQTSARVNQTLPGLARAAPAATAANVDLPTLEALTALGVRGGIPGNQVGTALLRSISNFAFRPRSQALFATQGITAEVGNYGSLITQILGQVGERSRQGNPYSGNELRSFAQALGGPSIGSRSILPILEAQSQKPGTFESYRDIALHPRPYQEDLGAVLGTVSERFKAIGIALQNFGSQLAQSGLLTPITGLLDAFVALTHVVEGLTSPVAHALSVFNELPGVVRDAIGVFAAFRIGSALLNTRFGTGAQLFAGRLPGLGALRDSAQQRAAVEGIRGNLEREILPADRQQAENASRRLREAQGRVADSLNAIAATEARAPSNLEEYTHPDVIAYNENLTAQRGRLGRAERAVPGAEQDSAEALARAARTEAQIALTKNEQFSWAERAALLEPDGFYALSETVSLQRQLSEAYAARVAEMRAGGGPAAAGPISVASGGASAEGALAAGAAVAVGTAATALANNPQALSKLQTGLEQAGLVASPSALRAAQADQAASGGLGLGALPVLGATSAAALRNQLAQRVSSTGGRLSDAAYYLQPSSLRQGAENLLSGPAAPFAGLIGTQLLGSAIGGGTGNYITNVGGQAATGAILAQLLGRGGPAGILAGATAGAVAGNFSRGGNNGLLSLLGGIGGGGLAALAAGIATGPVGLAAGAGALIGSTVLPAIFGSGNGGQKPQPSDAALAKQLQPQSFASNLDTNLTQAITGTGTSAASAQNWLTKVMQNLTAQIGLFGASSAQGKQAEAELSQAVAAGISTINTDPAAAKQLLDGAQQALSGVITRTSLVLKYADPGARATALNSAFAQLNAVKAGPSQDLAQLEAQHRQQQAELLARGGPNAALVNFTSSLSGVIGGEGTGQQIAGLNRADAATRKKIADYKAVLDNLDRVIRDMKDQLALAGLQRTEADNAATTQLRQARTADPTQRAAIALQGDQRNLAAIRDAHLSGSQRRQQLGTAQTQLFSDQQAYAQAQVDQLSAASSVAQNAIPSVDPIARASAALQGQQAVYSYMAAHTNVFVPAALANAYASVEAAQQALADATYQQQSELVQAQGQLAAAQAHGDAGGIAAAAAQTARGLLSIARTPAQRLSAQAQLIEAGTQAQEAARTNADLQGQIAQASDFGNTVQQANDAIATANQQLGSAQNTQERLQAQLQLINAQHQLQQALADRYTALGQLAASQTVDPVQQALDQQRAAARVLGVTTGVDNRVKARTSLNQYTHQYEQALIQQKESVIDFQFQMSQITAGQAAAQIEALAKQKGVTLAQRQALLEQARRYQLGLESPIGGSGFDLAPGNIRLPTYYDVAHAIRGHHSIASVTHHIDAHTESPQITVNVYDRHQLPAVADALDRATGGTMRSRLKAAGVN